MADRSRGTYVNETSPVNIQLSEEEKAVLKECRTNSLYFRGIPLGVIAAIATRQIVNQGYFPHVKRFSSIYYPAIFGLGLVVGIGSYRQKCFEKIMKLEHSTLADQVRDFYSKAGIPMDTPGGRSFNYQPHLPKEGGDNFSEDSIVQAGDSGLAPNKPQGAQNTMEFNREPFYQGSGEVIAMPNQLYVESKGQDTKQTTYEELRQRHRSRSQPTYQFESKQPSHGADQRSEKPHIMDDRKTLPLGRMPTHKEYRSSSHETQQAPVRRNKYGDVVE